MRVSGFASGLAASTLLAVTLLSGTAARAAEDAAVQTVRGLYASFEGALKAPEADVKSRALVIGPVLDQSMDFATMARVAVGAKWKGFTPEQQGALTEAFKQYFTATYATRLSQAAGGKFDIKPESEARGQNRVVQTEVANAGATPRRSITSSARAIASRTSTSTATSARSPPCAAASPIR